MARRKKATAAELRREWEAAQIRLARVRVEYEGVVRYAERVQIALDLAEKRERKARERERSRNDG